MTHIDPRLEMLLESARGAREPSAGDRARNLTALESRLGLLQSGERQAAAPQAPAPAAREVTRTSSAALRWKLGSLGVLTATLGFLVGLGVGREVSDSRKPAAAPALAGAVAAVERVEPPVAQPSPAPQPAAAEPIPESSARSAPAAHSVPVRAAKRVQRSEPRAQAAPAAGTFLEALRLVQRAQRALDGGDAAYALSLLDELDARFPPGMLAEERQVTRALGWCARGERERARSAAESLLAGGQSIYSARLQRSCVRR